ncbi:hypothetical protein [uncultured Pseudokineococcus sp.]|uniref:AMIN-like domain-containing (lipo)protein n=1 Tax=uncultured Pseudokineococcus sp. TaxID=1642928 RepID=UPI002605E726|nr:hypothetical protein [uncultured Pseudokineococcus sp.]
MVSTSGTSRTTSAGRGRGRGLRRAAGALLTAALLAVPAAAGAAPASAATACRTAWGSGEQVALGLGSGAVTGVRSGRHACFDRLVVDVRGEVGGTAVLYVDEVTQDGSGAPVPLRGGARLLVVVGAPSHDEDFRPTYAPASPRELVDVRGATTLRQVALAGSFEGQTTLGVGVRARLPFRSFVVRDGATSRVVVDVAHRW